MWEGGQGRGGAATARRGAGGVGVGFGGGDGRGGGVGDAVEGCGDLEDGAAAEFVELSVGEGVDVGRVG